MQVTYMVYHWLCIIYLYHDVSDYEKDDTLPSLDSLRWKYLPITCLPFLLCWNFRWGVQVSIGKQLCLVQLLESCIHSCFSWNINWIATYLSAWFVVCPIFVSMQFRREKQKPEVVASTSHAFLRESTQTNIT